MLGGHGEVMAGSRAYSIPAGSLFFPSRSHVWQHEVKTDRDLMVHLAHEDMDHGPEGVLRQKPGKQMEPTL